MSIDTMQELLIGELLIDELKDLYSAENQILRTLPKLAKAVSDPSLREALQTHSKDINDQIERLDKIGKLVGKNLGGKSSIVMKGVLNEGSEVLDAIDEGTARDAMSIAVFQRVENYEMAGCGAALAFAKVLGLADVTELLAEMLNEEKNADMRLTEISKLFTRKPAKQAA